ncbi:hypothetical protein [Kaistella sp.]|uniref:hypothetical protein n=1 Tax=Kaistella sp. TaxID=2782235 RepID=UPI002F93A654
MKKLSKEQIEVMTDTFSQFKGLKAPEVFIDPVIFQQLQCSIHNIQSYLCTEELIDIVEKISQHYNNFPNLSVVLDTSDLTERLSIVFKSLKSKIGEPGLTKGSFCPSAGAIYSNYKTIFESPENFDPFQIRKIKVIID